jgi:hypothetical protein
MQWKKKKKKKTRITHKSMSKKKNRWNLEVAKRKL